MPETLKQLVLRLLKVPAEPEAPLGSSDSLLVFRAAPGYLRYRLARWGISQLGWLIGCAAIGGVLFIFALLIASKIAPAVAVTGAVAKKGIYYQVSPTAIPVVVGLVVGSMLIVLIAQMIVGYAVMRLDYEMRWYKVTDRSLRIREGVVVVREMTMSFANIQNISITQGPLQSMFGVADLVVESAGGGPIQPGELNLHVGAFRGIDNAEKLKEMMLGRLRALKDGGLGDHEDRREPSVAVPTDGNTNGQAMGLAVGMNRLDEIEALREVRDAAKALRAAAEMGAELRGVRGCDHIATRT
jgi:membrane protein YdbS with pleckstrin-like domain